MLCSCQLPLRDEPPLPESLELLAAPELDEPESELFLPEMASEIFFPSFESGLSDDRVCAR